MNNSFSVLLSFFGLFRVNVSTDATNIDAETETQTGANCSNCITVFFRKTSPAFELQVSN